MIWLAEYREIGWFLRASAASKDSNGMLPEQSTTQCLELQWLETGSGAEKHIKKNRLHTIGTDLATMIVVNQLVQMHYATIRKAAK